MECSYFKQSQCQSCNLLDKSYSDTLHEKNESLKKLFDGFSYDLLPAIGLSVVERSRSKAKFAVFTNAAGDITFGFTKSTGEHQELEECTLHDSGINELLPLIKTLLVKYNIAPYDLKTKKGELKFVLISKSSEMNTSNFLVRFVLRSKESLDRLKKMVLELKIAAPEIAVVTANIQPVHQAILEGDEEILITEESYILHQFDEFQLALGARSFFQVTPEIAKRLYGAVADGISRDNPKSLVDLYCGVGAFSFYASRWCEEVSAVEISKEAILCAKASVKLNMSNIKFHAMDVEEYLKIPGLNFDAVIVNPPRRGLNPSIIDSILSLTPEFIYYSSCNAETLARDFLLLSDNYQIKSMQIFDMFPYTSHFETLMCLSRKNLL